MREEVREVETNQTEGKKPKVAYVEECDQIIVLKEGANPNTVNVPSLDEELELWRLSPKCPEVVGSIICGASVLQPKIVKALQTQRTDLYESVQEYFVRHLNRATSLLWKVLQEIYAEDQAKLRQKLRTREQQPVEEAQFV